VRWKATPTADADGHFHCQRYELTLHPGKTRFIDFRSYRSDGKDHPETDGSTFTFLGFCHVWGKSRRGKGHDISSRLPSHAAAQTDAAAQWGLGGRGLHWVMNTHAHCLGGTAEAPQISDGIAAAQRTGVPGQLQK
jgi:hypothetical protein